MSAIAQISTAKVAVKAPVAKASASAMRVWTPFNNQFFETMSYLPPLTDQEVARQIDYLTNSGFVPCIEFASEDQGIVSNENCIRFAGGASVTYQDNRYWTMYKLPMFGCTDSQEVIREIANCKKLFPGCYIRVVGFDNVRQVQCAGFLVQRPGSALAPEARSVA
ncbi:unnamed protein product [Pedinophyceae sp. YPF-701]|nr:unnamed protein product [Pedinophyceae sp. YPF-701]